MISPKSAFSKILRSCAFPASVLTTGRYWRTVLKLAGWAVLIFAALFALYCLVGGAVGWKHLAECWGEFTSGTDWIPDLGEDRYGSSSRLFAAAFFVRLAGLVFFGGVFISAVTNLFLSISDERTRGLFRYRREVFRNHFVIIGNGEETEALICAIFKGEFGAYAGEYIVIMTHADVESARERLLSELASERENRRGIVFYYGDLDSKECLRDLAPWNAREIFVLGDADDLSGRDVRNMSAMRLLDDIVGRRRGNACASVKRIPVNVQICSVSTYSAIQKLDNFDRGDRGDVFLHVAPRIFNFYETWARRLWGFFGQRDGGSYHYRDLDYLAIRAADDPHHVHLVVVGLNQMGLALVLEALRICHYANFDENAGGPKTRVTVVDCDPARKLFFEANYPNLAQIYDVDVDFVCASVESPEVRELISSSARERHCLLTVAICFESDDAALAAGLSLPDVVFEHRDDDAKHRSMKPGGNTVLIRQARRSEISRKLDRDGDRYKYVRRFGYANPEFESEFIRDDMPKLVNALYGKWQDLVNLSQDEKTELKEGMHASWLKLEEYKRWSNRFQVDSYRIYLRMLGFFARKRQKNSAGGDAALPSFAGEAESRIADMEHRRWLAERTLSGTRFWDKPFPDDESGDTVQDKLYRLHNCIRKTSALPFAVLRKDIAPIVNAPVLLKDEGYEFIRISEEEE